MPIATMEELEAQTEIEVDGSLWKRSEDNLWTAESGAKVRSAAFAASLRALKVTRPGEWSPDLDQSYYEGREMYVPIAPNGQDHWWAGHYNGSYSSASFVEVESIDTRRLRAMNRHEPSRMMRNDLPMFRQVVDLHAQVARLSSGTRVTDALVTALRREAENSDSLAAVLREHGLHERKATVTVRCTGTLPPSQIKVGDGITVTASVPWEFTYEYETDVSYEADCGCPTFVPDMARDRAPKGHTGFTATVTCSLGNHAAPSDPF